MLQLKPETQAAISQHAREIFPDECCGAIVTVDGREEVHRITNVQNAMHEKDPHTYPRDASIAYFMEPTELFAVVKAVDEGRVELTAFYHSHPNHDAYFSAEDKTQAMFGDEPSYPETSYLVISIHAREVRTIKAFGWDDTRKDFVETGLQVSGECTGG